VRIIYLGELPIIHDPLPSAPFALSLEYCRSKGEDHMAARLGQVIYWGGCVIAILIPALVAFGILG
jgi:hypothetical protein